MADTWFRDRGKNPWLSQKSIAGLMISIEWYSFALDYDLSYGNFEESWSIINAGKIIDQVAHFLSPKAFIVWNGKATYLVIFIDIGCPKINDNVNYKHHIYD